MKRAISVLLFLLLLISFSINAFATNDAVMPRINNAVETTSSFLIDENGVATILTSYRGTIGITQTVSVNVRLQKKLLLVFWNDVEEWTNTSSDVDHTFVNECSVKKGSVS